MKLLIDTNVILDMVFMQDGYDTAMEMFRKISEDGDDAYVTASSMTDLFYIINKGTHDTGRTYAIMKDILRLIAVFSVTEKDIRDAFGQRWRDFEDCVQYMTGKKWGRLYHHEQPQGLCRCSDAYADTRCLDRRANMNRKLHRVLEGILDGTVTFL